MFLAEYVAYVATFTILTWMAMVALPLVVTVAPSATRRRVRWEGFIEVAVWAVVSSAAFSIFGTLEGMDPGFSAYWGVLAAIAFNVLIGAACFFGWF